MPPKKEPKADGGKKGGADEAEPVRSSQSHPHTAIWNRLGLP